MKQKGIAHLFLIVVVVIIGIGAIGYFAYQNAQQKRVAGDTPTTPETTEIPITTSAEPSVFITTSPSPTRTQAKGLTYNLPNNWKKITSKEGSLEVGYDASRYEVSAGEKSVELSGMWVTTEEGKPKRLGWNKSINIDSYSGGSRHQELYDKLGVSPTSTIWKRSEYSEREYSYFGWRCLVLNGISISQYPVVWGMCPVSESEAIYFEFDGYDWYEIEQQLSAIRIIK